MTINVSNMSNAELIQWKKNLESSQNTQDASIKFKILKELELRGLDEDCVSFTSSTEIIQNNFDANAVNETMESIAADAAILSEYDTQYNELTASQTDLEAQCSAFEYPNIESITTSSKAANVLKDVEAQIKKIETLIKTTESAIKVLQDEKKVAQAQLEKRENEKEKLEKEMESIKKQIENNENQAKQEAEQYEQNATKMIETYTKEYEASNMQNAGVKLEDFLAGKMKSFQLPTTISALYAENDSLITSLNTKGEQIKLIASAIDTINTKITNIDKQLDVQNGKLEDYNKNLNAAKQYESGVKELKSALKQKEKAKRKKKKWYKKLAKKLVKFCNKLVKKIVNVVKKTIKSITGAVSGTLKFAGKHLGDITKSLGLGDELLEGIGNILAATTDFVGATCTFDKNEMKQSLKDLEDGAQLMVESKIIKTAVDVYKDVTEAVGDIAGDVVDGALNAVGTVLDKAGLDSLGNGIKATGDFFEGIIDVGTGLATANGSLISDGWEATKDNAMAAATTIGTVVATVATAGSASGITGSLCSAAGSAAAGATGSTVAGTAASFLTQEAIKETGNSVLEKLGIDNEYVKDDILSTLTLDIEA